MASNADNSVKMRNGFRLVVLLASTAFAMVGCQQPSAVPVISGQTPDQQTISVSELVRLLNLRVDETTPTHIILRRSGNTVMIFTHKGGPVYINAKQAGKVSRIEAGEVYIARSILSQIRSVMGAPEPGPGPGPDFSPVSGCVVIDAGHGGKDPGATSCLGFYEKSVNLAVTRKVAYLLRRRGIRVEMTRTGDYYIELEERAAIANRLGADLFVSIHADSSPKSLRRGFTLYVANGASWSSRRAAGALANSMAGTGLSSHGTRKANYRVLVATSGPAVLVELGYLSNYREAALLRDSSFQDRLAQAIADGILDYFG